MSSRRREQLFLDMTEACRSGDIVRLSEALEDNISILESRDSSGRTLLHFSTQHEETSVADLILSIKPDLLVVQDNDGYTVLHLSAISGNTTLLKFFLNEAKRLLQPLEFTSFINCFDVEKHTALHWATVSGELDSLVILDAVGADPSLADLHGAHPIHYAAQSELAVIGGGFAATNNKKTTMILKELLSFAPNEIDVRDKDGRTPLIWAASSGNVDAVLTLITAKCDVSLQDKDGLTALHCAASRGFLECLEALITFGAAVIDAPDFNGCSSLFYAVTLGHAECVQFLLTNGAFVNHQDRRGRTAAHCGSTKGQLETIKILYNKGGNLWLRNFKGDFPVHDAVRSGRRELVLWLLDHSPASLDFGNNVGKSPLHVACLENNVELCKVLIDYGLDVNSLMKLKGGLLVTPLDVCLQKGFRSCAKFLLLHGALPSSKLHASHSIEGPSPTVYSRRLPDQVNRQSDSDSGGAGYSSSIGFNSHCNGYHSSFHHNHTHTSESSNSLREVILPIGHRRLNPVVNADRPGRAPSRVSQKVKIFAEIPATPSTVLSTATDSEQTPHTMITNVYVSAFPASRGTGSRRKLKKIRRRGGSKSRSPSLQRDSQEPHSFDIWKAGDQVNEEDSNQEETNGSGSEVTRSSSLIDSLDLPAKIVHESIVRALEVIENGSSTTEEARQQSDQIARLKRQTSGVEGRLLDASVPEVDQDSPSLVSSEAVNTDLEKVELPTKAMNQEEGQVEQGGRNEENEEAKTVRENEQQIILKGQGSPSLTAETTTDQNNNDKDLCEKVSFESQGNRDSCADPHYTAVPAEKEEPSKSPVVLDQIEDKQEDVGVINEQEDTVTQEEYPDDFEEPDKSQEVSSGKKRVKRSFEENNSEGQEESSQQQLPVTIEEEKKQLLSPPTPSSPFPDSNTARDTLQSPLMHQQQLAIMQTEDEAQGEVHLVVPNLTEEERSGSISPVDVNEYRESDLATLPLIRQVSEAEAVKIQRELMERTLKGESSDEQSQDANNNHAADKRQVKGKRVVKKKVTTTNPVDPTRKLSMPPKGRGKWDKKAAGTPHDKVLPLTDKDRETAEDTLNEMTSIDTDDSSVRESGEKKRQERRKKNQETRDEITEEVVFDLPSGQRIRATTTLELKTTAQKRLDIFEEDDEEEGDRKYATLPRIAKGRRRQEVEKRGMSSQCTHRLHRKQGLKPVPPINLKNVKPKVDTKTPETFGLIRNTPSFHSKTAASATQPTDARMEMNRFAHELSRSSKKYAIERKLFEELQDLKRCQIKANKSHETILVKKLADRFNADVYYPGLEFFSGSYDFESYEQFLYDQLQKLSLREALRAKASSEENINFLGIGESFLGQKSFSAEVLMAKPREHFHTRFLDLDEKDKSKKPGVTAPTPEEDEDDRHSKCHRRITSDVVKTVEALDYGIITRAPPKPTQSFLPCLTDGKPSQSKPSELDRNVINVKTNLTSHHRLQDNKRNPLSDKTTVTTTYVTTITSAPLYHRSQHRSLSGKRGSYSSPSKRRIPSRIPRKTPIVIDTESISRRWEAIKEQERRSLEENRARFQDSIVMLYEVSGSEGKRRKSESHADTGVQVSMRPYSRTMSDGVLPPTNNFC